MCSKIHPKGISYRLMYKFILLHKGQKKLEIYKIQIVYFQDYFCIHFSFYPQKRLYPTARLIKMIIRPMALGRISMRNIPIANQINANPITFFMRYQAPGRMFGIFYAETIRSVHHFRLHPQNSGCPSHLPLLLYPLSSL